MRRGGSNRGFLLTTMIILGIAMFIGSTSALSPQAALDCSLEGTIQVVEFQKEGSSGSPGQMIHWPDRYMLQIKVEKISDVQGGSKSCEQAYPLESLQTIHVAKETMNEGDVFEANIKISGLTSRFFGTYFNSYTLGNIKKPLPEEPKPPIPPIEDSSEEFEEKLETTEKSLLEEPKKPIKDPSRTALWGIVVLLIVALLIFWLTKKKK